MELSFSFALLAYYTWWILLLVALIIIIYKLVTQQNFQVSLRVGINSSGNNNEPDQFTLQPVLLHRKSKKPCRQESDSESDKDKDTRYKLKKLVSVNNFTMAPSKPKKHNTRSVTGATGHKLTVNLKNNLAKSKTSKTVTVRQQSKKVGKNLYTILTHNSAGQAQNPVKAVDCTKKNQNFNSKSGTKMASSQESDLVTVNRDVFVGSISNRHGDSDGDTVKSLLWMLTRAYHQTMWNNTMMVWSLIWTSMRMTYHHLLHRGGCMT